MAKTDWDNIIKTTLWIVAGSLLAIWLVNNVYEISQLVKPRGVQNSTS